MSHFISLSVAEVMTEKYRANKEDILKTQHQNLNILPLSETFAKAAFQALLNKSGCESLRIYYGMDDELKIHAIIVAVDEDNNDILNSQSDDIVDNGNRCPDLCPSLSPLNS